jgi:hypothetical protein
MLKGSEFIDNLKTLIAEKIQRKKTTNKKMVCFIHFSFLIQMVSW